MGNFICNDCGAEISPEWKHCIASNKCPGCGGAIMSEEQQLLIVELGEAMEKMPNDPIGVAGWLVFNYNLQKIGDGAPIGKFHDKNNRAAGVVDDGKLPHEKQDKVSDFFKRGGYDVDKIQQAEAAKRKALNGNGGDITGTNLEEYDDEYVSDDGIECGLDPISEVNSLMGNNGGSGESNDNAIARTFLEKKRIAQLEAQKNVANGVGAVSRSGAPAGFRRG